MSTRHTKNPEINGVRRRDSNYFSLRRCKIDKNKYAPTVRNDEAGGGAEFIYFITYQLENFC